MPVVYTARKRKVIRLPFAGVQLCGGDHCCAVGVPGQHGVFMLTLLVTCAAHPGAVFIAL